MKNYKELMQALLDGKELKLKNFNTKLHLNLEGRLCFTDSENTLEYSDDTKVHLTPTRWEVHDKKNWYNNIPKGGVLCWASTSCATSKDRVANITGFNNCPHNKFISLSGYHWIYATPLTPMETIDFHKIAISIENMES